MSVEIDFDTGPALPGRVIALGLIALAVGLAFGFAASQTMFARQLESTRLEDARAVHDALKVKVQEFEEIREKLLKLNPDQVDFDAVAKLAKVDFAVSGTSIGSRTLFDAAAIDSITSYTADSQMLAAAIKDHDRITNTVDKVELEKLAAENEVLKNQFFGVIFDYRHAIKNGDSDKYLPKEGRLVINHGPAQSEESKGKITIEVPLSGKKRDIEVQGFIPIAKSQILKSSGGNALTRYNYRTRQIKFRTIKLAKQTDGLLASLARIYDGTAAEPAAAPDDKEAE